MFFETPELRAFRAPQKDIQTQYWEHIYSPTLSQRPNSLKQHEEQTW